MNERGKSIPIQLTQRHLLTEVDSLTPLGQDIKFLIMESDFLKSSEMPDYPATITPSRRIQIVSGINNAYNRICGALSVSPLETSKEIIMDQYKEVIGVWKSQVVKLDRELLPSEPVAIGARNR